MKSNRWKLIVVVVLILCAVWWYRSNRRRTAPDVELAGHFESICRIADRYATRPQQGVTRLFHYLGEHSPHMLHDFGQTLVVVERIADDERHDERAAKAADRLRAPLQACADSLQRFGEAIEQDPDANAQFSRGVERLVRTLMILIGAESTFTPAWLPAGDKRDIHTWLDALAAARATGTSANR